MMSRVSFLLLIYFTILTSFAQASDYRWWPTQKKPKALIRTSINMMAPGPGKEASADSRKSSPEHMMVQSVAGLAAQAVNQNQCDELVWVELEPGDSHQEAYQLWYKGAVQRLDLEDRGRIGPWELLERFQLKGIIKGYVLYSFDRSKGGIPLLRPGIDHSANAATVAAGVLQAVMISEEIEARAQKLGLKKLLDVRGKDEKWAFGKFKDKLNTSLALAQDPKMPHHRDIAIANKCMVLFGMEEPTPSVYQWLTPLSAIMGWNVPGEGEFIEQLSLYGHHLLPSNWCMNLPVLSAGSEAYDFKPFKSFNPNQIDWEQKKAVSFFMSDGDNVQWLMGNFAFDLDYYWANPHHGDFAFGWGMPYACLMQVCPETYNYLQETQPDNTTLVLHAGGYFMPDKLGLALSKKERHRVLTEHARRVSYYMNEAGCTTYMFLPMNAGTPEAIEAYEIFAREIDNLTGMFAIQYETSYQARDGEIFWVKNKKGIEIPVVTCKYVIWANFNAPRAGTPARIARLINEEAADATQDKPMLDWAMVHAWSGFKKIADNHETAENATFMAPGTKAGVTPVKWCIDRLDNDVKVVSPEELLWRIRMHHHPAQTRKALGMVKK